MRLLLIFSVVLFIFYIAVTQAAHVTYLPDTITKPVKKLDAGMSFTAFQSGNTANIFNKRISVETDIDWRRVPVRLKGESFLQIKSELGFTAYVDSIREKNKDRFTVLYRVQSSGSRLKRNMNIIFMTGILNDHEYIVDANTGARERRVTGTFLNPATLEAGPGMEYQLFRESTVNLSLSTARLRTIPAIQSPEVSEGITLLSRKYGSLVFDYGIQLQYDIVKEIKKGIVIKSNGKLFIKNFRRDAIDGEIAARIDLMVSDRVRIKIETKIQYHPTQSETIQFHHEIMMGLYYVRTP